MIVLYTILGLLVLLLAVLFINTAVKGAKARKLLGDHPVAAEGELRGYAETLRRMIACKTVSVKDSYDDTEFQKLREVVKEEFPLLHEKAERMTFSDDFWLYKVPGKDPTRNILLMSHHDVVPVPADEKWDHDPFGGEVVDGTMFGRGTADTKGSLCGILYAVEGMLADGVTPPVNLYVGSSHNEELGGDGVTSARDYFLEKGIRFEVVLDEGGAIVDPPLGKSMKCEACSMVAVHEKGRCRLVCKATTESSHISLTGYKNNPVERMAAFIAEVSASNIFIKRLNPQVRELFGKLGPYCNFPLNLLFANLWLFGGILKRVLPKINPTAGGMVGTVCTFQKIQGGMTDKVCTANALLRHNSEEDLDRELEAFRAIAKKYGVEVEIEHREFYKPADTQSPAYAYTMETLAKVFPRFPAAPYILPAGTDAWKLTPVCDCVLRFAPTRMRSNQLGSIHAVNENLDVSAVYEAAAFYRTFVENYR